MDPRPSRDQVLMQSAWLWATRSSCSRLHVGAVFAKDSRILVTGYNGVPAGLPHCDHTCDCIPTQWEVPIRGTEDYFTPSTVRLVHEDECNSELPCTEAEHAERNAIAYAARYGVGLDGSSLYVTHMPCLACAMSIINAGVKKVHYQIPYRLIDGVELLDEVGIEVVAHEHSTNLL